MSVQEKVIADILQARQAAGVAAEMDDRNSDNDWIAYILAYLGRASRGVFRNDREKQEYRDNLIKAGGLIVSALVAHARRANRIAEETAKLETTELRVTA